jgi:hypothetical protein
MFGTDPLALNLYLTLPANSLPLLEPLYLLTDLTNMLTLGAFPNPLGTLANALAPALTSLVNLGYTDVVRMPDGTYVRTLDQAGDPTAFMSFPDVDWAQVPGDIVNLFVRGFQKELFSGSPTPGTPNVLTGVFKLLSSILGGGGLGGIDGLINAALGGLSPLAATALPAIEAKSATVAPDPGTSAGNNAAPVSTPIVVATSNDAKVDEKSKDADQEAKSTKPEKKPSGSTSTTKAAGPSASPKPKSPVGSVVGGVTSGVGVITGGVTHAVGGLTGGLTGGLSGALGGG